MALLNIQKYPVFSLRDHAEFDEIGGFLRIDPETLMILIILSSRASCFTSVMPVVFIHCPYSNPHPPQMGRVWVENNYPLKKWGGRVGCGEGANNRLGMYII
jgi:hypothetical protein